MLVRFRIDLAANDRPGAAFLVGLVVGLVAGGLLGLYLIGR